MEDYFPYYFFKGLYAISAIQKDETNKRYIITVIDFKTFRKICFSPRKNGKVQVSTTNFFKIINLD